MEKFVVILMLIMFCISPVSAKTCRNGQMTIYHNNKYGYNQNVGNGIYRSDKYGYSQNGRVNIYHNDKYGYYPNNHVYVNSKKEKKTAPIYTFTAVNDRPKVAPKTGS